ncbi:MAG: hypothetical protein UHD09_09295 [Bifidobacterium sp.]|nr:hypothetical protein [Bifidobacterium sp.]
MWNRIGEEDMQPDDVHARVWAAQVILDDVDGALDYFRRRAGPMEIVRFFEVLDRVIERTQDPRIVPCARSILYGWHELDFWYGLSDELDWVVEHYGDERLKAQAGLVGRAPVPEGGETPHGEVASRDPDDPDGEGPEMLPQWLWTMTANVVDERLKGAARELVHGTKAFSPGTKVYVSTEWHMSYKASGRTLRVIGRARHSRRFVCMFVPRDTVMNFRVRQCHKAQAIRHMAIGDQYVSWWGGQSDEKREELKDLADFYNHDEIAQQQAQAERDGTLSVTLRSLKQPGFREED